MKKKLMMALLAATMMALGAVDAFALDYNVPEDATTVTMRFTVPDATQEADAFIMVSEDGELTIHITNDTIVYFEDYVPLSDDGDAMTQMAREVLFGRTLGEVLDGRNMRVIYNEENEAISVMILFEIAVNLPQTLTPEEVAAVDVGTLVEAVYDGTENDNDAVSDVYETSGTPLAPDASWDGGQPTINGEVVVNNTMLENAPAPFWHETESGNYVMVPLRVVAEALDYDVRWNDTLASIQLGVAIHLWPGNTEVHIGRMAPQFISTAPVIIDGVTFVPMDFFQVAFGKTAYLFEGQVVVESDSDMR